MLVAAYVMPGIYLKAAEDRLATAHDWLTLGAVALIFGLVNALVRPVVFWLTLPLRIVTRGLFILINALILIVMSWIAGALGFGFRVDGFLQALLAARIVSLVSVVLTHAARGL